MSPDELLKYFEERQDAMVAEIRELVDIETPTYDVAASRRLVSLLEEKFRAIDIAADIERTFADGIGDHLVIRTAGEKNRMLILGHTDTVHPTGTAEKDPTRVENGRLYGCGVFDMKANIVLMLEALRYFAATGDDLPAITILLSCDEEVGSPTGRPLVEREARAAARGLVFEPSSAGKVKTGRKGTGQFKLVAHGVPAHAGLEPEKGANAIAELARQIGPIHSITRAEAGTTVNVTIFHGGTASNVIPSEAACDIDVRFSSMDEAARIEKELRALTPTDPRVTLELLGEINRPPLERTDAVVSLFEEARQLAASFGQTLHETQVGGGSDGNFVAALGVPVLDGLGIAGDGAHTLDEYILIDDIAPRATLASLLISR